MEQGGESHLETPVLASNLDLALQPAATSVEQMPSSGSTGAPAGAPGGCGGGGIDMLILPGMLILMYLMLIRPQQKKQKEHDQLVSSLKKGMRVRTSGGIRGDVVDVTDDEVSLLIADRTKIHVLRSHVSAVIPPAGAASDGKKADAKKADAK